MHRDGLNLGQIPFPASYTRPPKIQAGPTPSGSPKLQIGPMFELAAGQIQRPFNERSSVPTTLVSSLVHGGMLLGMFVLVSSGEIALPDPQEALHLTAILVAAPPPPPPPAAAPPAPAPPAPEPSEVPLPEVPSVLPKLDLLIPEPVQEEIPELSLPAGPALTAGFGSGEGSGFGVEGGVGFGDSMSSAGPEPVRIGGAVTPRAHPPSRARLPPVRRGGPRRGDGHCGSHGRRTRQRPRGKGAPVDRTTGPSGNRGRHAMETLAAPRQ